MKDDAKETGLRLLKKGKQSIFRMIFSRSGLIIALLAVQVLFLFTVFHWFEEFLPHIYGGVVIFTVFMVLYLLNSSMDPTSKITWLVVVMLLPVFGALLFLYTQKNIGHRALTVLYAQLNKETENSLKQNPKRKKPCNSPTPEPLLFPNMLNEADVIPYTTAPPLNIFLWVRISLRKCLYNWKKRNISYFWNTLS